MPLIAAFLARFGVWLLAFVGPLLVKVALTFGISFVGYHLGTGPFVALVQSALSGAPALVVQIIAGLKLDQAMTVILSAHAAKYASRFVMQRASA